MNRLRLFLLIGLMFVSLTSITSYAQPKDDDIWPWPWGSECPFPWNDIEGLWRIKNKQNAGYFRFELTKTDHSEGFLVRIDHIDMDGNVTASGSGFASYSQKIVRAALHSTVAEGKKSYWVIVRAYEMDKNVGCSGSVQTVVTLRPVYSDKSWELNYEIEQVLLDLSKQ
ncbi:MAG: hypothetical protein KDD61_04770 [Bdellovibrionales bacterium]|nr:hypothetical protein [Bdellovibrionales bacterium]